MIIDTSYFRSKSTFIPNAVTQPTIGANTPSAVDVLQMEIDQREYEVLINALGIAQTTELVAQFDTDFTWLPGALQKWKDLVDGKTYGDKKWNGLRYTVGTKKVSLIAFYTFFHYLRQDFSTYTTTGVQIPRAENSMGQDPSRKQAAAWNEYVRMYCGFNASGRGYTFFSNWCGYGMRWTGSANANITEVSLLEFMQDHPDDYSTAFFKMESVVNSYGL
mgnify:CR=1 FL=1